MYPTLKMALVPDLSTWHLCTSSEGLINYLIPPQGNLSCHCEHGLRPPVLWSGHGVMAEGVYSWMICVQSLGFMCIDFPKHVHSCTIHEYLANPSLWILPGDLNSASEVHRFPLINSSTQWNLHKISQDVVWRGSFSGVYISHLFFSLFHKCLLHRYLQINGFVPWWTQSVIFHHNPLSLSLLIMRYL